MFGQTVQILHDRWILICRARSDAKDWFSPRWASAVPRVPRNAGRICQCGGELEADD